MSLLSASLRIPVPEDLVFTGHIGSLRGEIRAVGNLWEKMEAASADGSITTFVCPSLEEDKSLNDLSPRQRQHDEDAVRRRQKRLQIRLVGSIAQALQVAYRLDSIVRSALECGFFDAKPSLMRSENPVDESIRFLAEGNERRFEEVVETALFSGSVSRARELLLARLRFHIQRGSYPKDFGLRLLQIVASLPPHLLRRRDLFPLLPLRECIRLSQFAKDSDLKDVSLLHDAVRGKGVSRALSSVPTRKTDIGDPAEALLESILSQIGAVALSESVGNRVDAARLSFRLISATVDSDREFYATIESFLVHLQRVCGVVTEAPPEAVADEAYALLSRAFSRLGGPQAALAEGLGGARGAMRYVLDAITDTFKREEESKRVDRILQESLMGPDKWKERVKVAEALLRRFGPALPAEIGSKTPEQCAHHLEALLRVAASSMDQVQSLLRAL